ncbi:WD40-repeat-containing domain protein [Gaertneriomyces semiglobifer]|nr:WD40-repeat-containing domain protein [Gaertneriomyces semiglobifer]
MFSPSSSLLSLSPPTQTQRPAVTSFSSPEGDFVLIREIQYEPSVLPPNLTYGTDIAFVTTKSKTLDAQSSSSDLQELANQPTRFVDVPVVGDDKGTFSFIPKEKLKSKKSKPISTKSSSTFITKIVANENLAKLLSHRPPETTYMIHNVGRAIVWSDYASLCTRNHGSTTSLSGAIRHPDTLAQIYFKDAFVTCFDINSLTRDSLDVIVGFNTGEIAYLSLIPGKFVRLNKGGVIIKSGVTSIKWLPASESLFLAGFEDGSVLGFDVGREDPKDGVSPGMPSSKDGKEKDKESREAKEREGSPRREQREEVAFATWKSPKGSKANPVSWWAVGRKGITAIAFSPDTLHLALTTLSGHLHILNHTTDKLLDSYRSYFGALTCCAWSPDGKYVLTGGQDDLISVWGFRKGGVYGTVDRARDGREREGGLVCRGVGHSSWVKAVVWERGGAGGWRFASVGDDTRLILWDFSLPTLHRPKMSSHPHRRSHQSYLNQVSLSRRPAPPAETTHTVHPVMGRSEVAMLEPFMVKSIHDQPLTCVVFREDAIVTADRSGIVKIWGRPGV